MRRAIPPIPQYVFMAWCLIKHRDNFTFFTVSLSNDDGDDHDDYVILILI